MMRALVVLGKTNQIFESSFLEAAAAKGFSLTMFYIDESRNRPLSYWREQVKRVIRKQAIEKLNAGEYQEAIELFAELPEYKDSDQYALYTGGLKAFYEGDLEEAKEKFDNSMEIEDAALYASYINGVNSMEEGFSTESYENAYSAFVGAGGLLDSAELAVYTRGVADFLSGDTAAADMSAMQRMPSGIWIPSKSSTAAIIPSKMTSKIFITTMTA